MSFLDKLFGTTTPENESKLSWISLEENGQLDEIIKQSSEHPVLIFKHSTRCIISKMALKKFENEFDLQNKITLYFLDLLQYRSISNDIAEKFAVTHQSPQILLIKNGVVVYHASHENIDAKKLLLYI